MKKLFRNASGFVHHFVLVGAIVLTGIAGSAYLVLSHADSCDGTTDPTSSATSDASSDPSCPTSDPVTSPVAYSFSCTVSNVPSNVTSGAAITPIITFTNTGTGALTPAASYFYKTALQQTPSGTAPVVTASSIAAGQTTSVTLPSHTVTSKFNSMGTVVVSANTYGDSSATASCNNPSYGISVPTIKTVTINPSDWPTNKNNSIVVDPPKGNVIKVVNGAGLQTTSGSTYLTKLTNFTQADNGQTIKLCVTARVNKATSKPKLTVQPDDFNGTSNAVVATFTVTSSYTTQCKAFTIKPLIGIGYPNLNSTTIFAPERYSTIFLGSMQQQVNYFIDSVTLTLQ